MTDLFNNIEFSKEVVIDKTLANNLVGLKAKIVTKEDLHEFNEHQVFLIFEAISDEGLDIFE